MFYDRVLRAGGGWWACGLFLGWAAFGIGMVGIGRAEPAGAAVEWVPGDAVIAVEVLQPAELVQALTGKGVTQAVTGSSLYESAMAQPGTKDLLNVLAFLETTLGMDWRTALGKLAGGGMTFAICPGDVAILIMDAEDPQVLMRAHEMFLGIARSEAAKNGTSGLVASTQVEDVTAWTFNGVESHAIIGHRLVMTNRPEALRAVLEQRDRGPGGSLAENAEFRASVAAVGSGSVAVAHADLRVLRQVPGMKELFGLRPVNPLVALMFSGMLGQVRDAQRLVLGLSLENGGVGLRAVVDGGVDERDGVVAFAVPHGPGAGALRNLDVPRRLAALSVYRDLYQFYAAKDELFGERTSGLIFFENMMGIFFSGRDLTTEVLAQAEPEIRLVMAEQEYDSAVGSPRVKLPAFAAVFELRDPEHFDIVVEEAWQKAIGLVNFTRGQQAMPGLIIDRPTHGDTTFTVAYFSSAGEESGMELDPRFNFRPSIVTTGRYLILSSTDGLARDLIDALKADGVDGLASGEGIHSELVLDGAQLASILRANARTLVRDDMIKKGKTEAESEAGIEMLIELVRHVGRAKLSVGTREGMAEACLEVMPGKR